MFDQIKLKFQVVIIRMWPKCKLFCRRKCSERKPIFISKLAFYLNNFQINGYFFKLISWLEKQETIRFDHMSASRKDPTSVACTDSRHKTSQKYFSGFIVLQFLHLLFFQWIQYTSLVLTLNKIIKEHEVDISVVLKM